MNSIAIEIEELVKVFEKPRGIRRLARVRPTTAVNGVSLTVARGELFGLLGPNGAGKTTLTKILCTLILPTSGRARVAGHELSAGAAIRRDVGLVVADERSFQWRLTGRQNLEFFAAMHGLYGQAAGQRIDEVLEDVDMQAAADRDFADYSTGMRQRLAIARGLLHKPHILMLDEPSRSLDPTATARLHELILQLRRQGRTVFLITHDLAEAERLCDQVAVMHKGKIRAVGHPGTLRQQLRPQLHYTLYVDQWPEALWPALQQVAPGVARVNPGGGHPAFTFQASERDGRLPAVLDCLRQHDVSLGRIEGQPPSLEEVFAHYTQDQAENAPDFR